LFEEVNDLLPVPYWPVRELLRSWLDVGLSDSKARVRLELRAALARSLADNADEAYPFVATVIRKSSSAGGSARELSSNGLGQQVVT